MAINGNANGHKWQIRMGINGKTKGITSARMAMIKAMNGNNNGQKWQDIMAMENKP